MGIEFRNLLPVRKEMLGIVLKKRDQGEPMHEGPETEVFSLG
jgi:hypothetical protein